MQIRKFQTKLLALFIGLIVLVQIATFFAVWAAIDQNVRQRAGDELRVGERVLHRMLATRGQQRLTSLRALTADPDFRSAIAADDVRTIESLLDKYRASLVAGLAMAATPDGELIAGQPGERGQQFPFPDLLKPANTGGGVSSVLMFKGYPYQVVVMPVHTAGNTAWVSLGFRIDRELVEAFKSLTTLDLSLWGQGSGEYPYFMATTLGARDTRALAHALGAKSSGKIVDQPFVLENTDQLSLRIAVAGYAGHRILAVVQTSLADAFAPYGELRQNLIALSAVALILSVLVAVLIAKSVTRPVQALITAAREVEAGSYRHAVEVADTDEIGELTSTFNSVVYRAHHDSLTGLPNRQVVGDRLGMAVARAQRQGTSFALLLMDLNRFKEINDSLGHAAGDRVLHETAQRLLANARASDTVARQGGDEFLILLEDVNQAQALGVARKLIEALERPLALADTRIDVKVSMGAALYPLHAEDVETLMRRADHAMYEAKAGKSSLVIYKAEHDERHRRQPGPSLDLRVAIERQELFLCYEPKLAMVDRRIVQLGAAARWRHPERGLVFSEELARLARSAGYVRVLSNLVLNHAVRQSRRWSAHGLNLPVAVGLSMEDLLDAELAPMVADRLCVHGVAPDRLIFELPETVLTSEGIGATATLTALSELGVGLAVERFGADLSLGQLERLPLDELKIDPFFVQRINVDPTDAAPTRAVIALAHQLGLRATAPGVENEVCWSTLASYGCDMAQGALIGEPLSAAEVLRWRWEHERTYAAVGD